MHDIFKQKKFFVIKTSLFSSCSSPPDVKPINSKGEFVYCGTFPKYGLTAIPIANDAVVTGVATT